MTLYLRRIIHPQARDNYRVVLKTDGDEIEVGSIGVQHGTDGTAFWAWGIDAAIPMREADTRGTGKDRRDCMKQFRTAWNHFSADRGQLAEFLQIKRKRLR